MRIIGETLRYGARLELGGTDALRQRCGDNLLAVVGGGRGATLASGGDGGCIWLPLRGKLRINVGDGGFAIEPGQLFVSEPDQRLQATGRGAALWIALIAQRPGWRRALMRAGGTLAPEPGLVPAWHAAQPALRRLAMRVVRAVLQQRGDYALQGGVDDLLGSIIDLQADFGDMIERCPGRTLAQRQNVFLRLQRVRNLMATRCEQELDIPELARVASYSPWHFIRAFHAVYGETPHAYLVERRLERARRLVRSSPLAISEIAGASGFENRCAFSRLFKQRFGISAAALRREHGVGTRSRRRRCDADELPRLAVSATPPANSRQLGAPTDF
ncbi:MAG TPA: AraC family transcriptional regulator [Tahibacter sp.]|uniref:AraC family transcriptional regulator n=1 Tax=Tahibacter sp. TaxID=2056211 RepID=UPI002B6F125F|nr:AraC family transcriptional regulator [Tahibacter sp.]HSX62333.1 AraC family transcriptional regulator [Tahibacter sp.]